MRPLPLAALLFLLASCTSLLSTPAPSPTPTIPPGEIHHAEFAGSAYPADALELQRMVDDQLAAVQPVAGDPIALIVPHANLPFSGPVAAYSFAQLVDKDYDVAILIAADHKDPLAQPVSVWSEGGWETPLGVIPVDVELAQALLATDLDVTFDPAAFQGEHVVEVVLPFLQRSCPGCRVVPIILGTDEDEVVARLADALVPLLSGRRAVVIASSDLSHYPSRDDAVRVDGQTLDAIATGDPVLVRQTLFDTAHSGAVHNLQTCACGAPAIIIAMRVAQGLGGNAVAILRYGNSADLAHSGAAKVVGYGAVMFWKQ